MLRVLYLAFALIAVCTVLSCGQHSAAPGPALPQAGAPAPLALALPAPHDLAYPAHPPRQVSATAYELLANPPLYASSSGATFGPGVLSLDPAVAGDGLAWAIYPLYGFPADKSIYPASYSLTASTGCWIGYANYVHDHWQFTETLDANPVVYTDGTELLSPALVHYLAVIACDEAITATSLLLNTSADLPDPPVAVLSVLSRTVLGVPAYFSALGSSPGAAPLDAITFNWGDGTPDTVITDPAQEVEHTYTSTGVFTVKLTVSNTNLQSGKMSEPVGIVEPMRELLLVYNADIPEDLDLANYYASSRTGRAIDPAYILGITPEVAGDPETISREKYAETIREPIKAYLDANPTIKNNAKYILLCKGIPHKIPGTNGGDYTLSTYSSVDSELCLLYSDGSYAYEGWVWNGDYYWDMASYYSSTPGSMYLQGDSSFAKGTYKASDSTGAELPLDFLVCRLSAYSYDNVKQMIDRALNADMSGTGSILFDSCASRQALDTMVDPVWPWSSASAQKSGFERLQDAGLPVFQDITGLVLTGLPTDNITVPIDAVIGYAGWGVNHSDGSYPNGGNYILKDLLFTYLPGACFMSYESFNGRTFTPTNIDDPVHDSQGIIADFLYKGGTVAIGNAWEPWTIGVGDERWVFDRYINHGDRWIEAAYKGLRLLSWQEVVVGDPLCEVR